MRGRFELGLDDELRRFVEREAAAEGVSVAVYVREAVLTRLVLSLKERQDPDLERLLRLRASRGGAMPGGPDPNVAAEVHDPERLRALAATGLLDSPPEEAFDRLARLAAEALAAPTAAVSLVDEERQFFKAAVGLAPETAAERQTTLDRSLCQYAVGTGQSVVVEDAREHPVLRSNVSVLEDGLVAYLGMPLADADGHVLGTLCVWDFKPRRWTQGHLQILEDLAGLASQRIRAAEQAGGGDPTA
ncbi:MAG: GAF domain-containing protein [Actinomycetota bacterium]|nr:GAF domain-containing protein [Actinomycetota bacterium]